MLQKTKSAPWDDPDRSILPQVAVPHSRLPMILFAIALGVFGILLFMALEGARSRRVDPVPAQQAQLAPVAPGAELYIPPQGGFAEQAVARPAPLRAYYPAAPATPFATNAPATAAPRTRTAPAYTPPAPSYPAPTESFQLPPLPPQSNYQVPQSPGTGAEQPPRQRTTPGGDRVFAGRLASPSLTVVQGTLIGAVLETALDSTRPGAARALVTRDVKGFDGTRIVIPRGSRLYGEYQSDLAAGQNRALIRWTRLVRPDGVTIAINSPSADPLGRAGVRGSVNTHLLDRIANTILQAGSNFGQRIAGRQLPPQVIVAVPGATQAVSSTIVDPQQIRPTLTIKPGARVSVFVARDLDFSSVDPQ